MSVQILVVEDNSNWQDILRTILENEGFRVITVTRYEDALVILDQSRFFLAVVDVRLRESMADEEGIELLDHLARYHKNIKAVVLTGHGTIPQAAEVMRKYKMTVLGYLDKLSPGVQEQLRGLVREAYKLRFRCFKTGGDCGRDDLELKPNQVFVAMPYRSKVVDMGDTYELGIKPALQEAQYEPLRADEVFLGRDLMCNICKHVQESSICIVDISDWNPNVLLELGLMYGWGRPVILLKHKKSKAEVPVDLRGMLYLEYESTRSLKSRLTKCLRDLGY